MSYKYCKDRSEEVVDFLHELAGFLKTHNKSISHEDCHGGFIVEKYDEHNIEWLLEARDDTELEEKEDE